PAHSWRSPKLAGHAGVVGEAMSRQPNVVGGGTTGRCGEESGETGAVGGERGRGQSLRGTEEAKVAGRAESKAVLRDGRQEGGSVSSTTEQGESQASAVPQRATQGAERHGRDWSWVEASVWSERMLAALENGVKGGKWFSLIDKVYRAETLRAAWHKVETNAGAAGVDGQSVERLRPGRRCILRSLAQRLRGEPTDHSPCGAWRLPKEAGSFVRWGFRWSKTALCRQRLSLYWSPSLSRSFSGPVTVFVRGLAVKMHFGKWSGGFEKATPLWWMPILEATSTPSRTCGLWSALRKR